MNTSSRKDSQSFAGHSQNVMTLDCSNLRNNDLIIIRTQNDLYKFLITDAKAIRGRLVGEWRKTNFPEAVLIGALISDGGQIQRLNCKLQTAAHAQFVIEQGKEKMQFTTSPVIALGWFVNRQE